MTQSTFNLPGQIQDSANSSAPQATKPLIRVAHLEDVEQLTELLASSFYDRTGWMGWVYPLLKLGIQADLKQRIVSDRTRYACLTALTEPGRSAYPATPWDPCVAGTVEVSQRQAWPWQGLSPTYAYIANLAVAQSFRRLGIAGRLLVACEDLVRTWKMQDLYLHVMEDNLAAHRLYRRLGFQLMQAEETTATWLGLQPRRLLMHKRLTSPPGETPS